MRILLSDRSHWEICGEAQDGVEAIEKVAQLAPDVVILDLTMPIMNGLDAAQRIRQIAPSTKIVFFSIHDMPTTARIAGADAFVSKSCAAEDLERTINHVLEPGGRPFAQGRPN